MSLPAPDMEVVLGPLRLKNPVLTASGTFGYGSEYADLIDLNRLGGVTVKSITLEPRAGNPPPRIAETPAGMLNTIGLQNVGLEAFLTEKLPYLRQFDTAVLVNLSGYTIADYVQLCERLDGVPGVDGVELNVSCPNVDRGGMCFGVDPELLEELVAACRAATRLPLFVKLSPNVTDIVLLARVCADAGADGLSLINTLLGMAIDVKTRRPKLSRGVGGLSGPAIRPIAVRMVWEVAQAVPLPIIGMGGICSAEDALEFLLAGASAVAVGTAHFVRPTAALDILGGLEQYLRQEGIGAVRQIVGAVQVEEPEDLALDR